MAAAATAAKSLQSCPTLCDPIDGSPPGSPVPGILQARKVVVEWVAISFSNAWKWKVKGKSLSLVQLLATPWTAAYQAPLSMGFSRQEYWSGMPSPSPLALDYLLIFAFLSLSVYWHIWTIDVFWIWETRQMRQNWLILTNTCALLLSGTYLYSVYQLPLESHN